MVYQDEETRDWLGSKVPNLKAWKGTRLKMVGLDALPTYKSGGLVSGPCGRYRVLLSATP
jgi:hypothetical protein